jgi:hypothetical protein
MANNCKMVVFSDKAYNAIIRETFEWDPVETGGILLGHILDNGCWIVMEVLPPGYSEGREGDNVHHEMGYFEYNQRFVNYLANSVATQYKIPLELLGLWHRHPGSMDYFSSTDDGTNKTFASQNPNGAISGLVNVDPQLRMTMYYIRHNDTGMGRPNYLTVDVEVGSDLIPEEYFEMQYYGGENDELHPFAPRRNNQQQSKARQRVNEETSHEESGDINIGRIINDQLGYNDYIRHHGGGTIPHRNDVPDWYQQVANVFDQLKKKKLTGCLFSILIIVVCFFLIKQCWDGIKGMWPNENVIVTPDNGSKTDNTYGTEIKLVKDHFELKDYNPVKIETTPKIKEPLEWESTDSKIVTVNKAGEIFAVAKKGSAQVKTVYNEQDLICYVKVDIEEAEGERPPIEIENGDYSEACVLQKGQTHKLNIRCTRSDKNYDLNLLTWVSNDEKVVSVDKKGNVTAISTGTAEVVLCLGNTIVDTIKITVK